MAALSNLLTRSTLVGACGATVVALALSACGAKNNGQAGPPGGGRPAAQVGVVTVEPRTVGLVTELPGRLEASRVAQVRARVAGILQQRLFREGSDVKAGQLLFEIDSAPYRAAAASAEAMLARALANQTQAAAQAERYMPLVEPTPSANRSMSTRSPRRSWPKPMWRRPGPQYRRRGSIWAMRA